MRLSGCLVISLFLFTACLLPFVLVDLGRTALENLHLSPPAAILVLLGMLIGSFVNVPLARYPLDEEVVVPVVEPIGGWYWLPQYRRLRKEMVVAVNVGGCVIPVLLAVWLLRFVLVGGIGALTVVLVGVAINTWVCYAMARPIPNLGIALPAFLPPLIALSATWMGMAAPAYEPLRAPVAFVIGISGPLIGADLLHWKDFPKVSSGTVSIGGAGTWDGIVLSGLLAALLA